MKKGMVIINTSRGGLIDTDAVCKPIQRDSRVTCNALNVKPREISTEVVWLSKLLRAGERPEVPQTGAMAGMIQLKVTLEWRECDSLSGENVANMMAAFSTDVCFALW
eukprot:2793126-Rhodomonas_salina.1